MWALGLFEIIFFVVFFVLLVIGTSVDRTGNEGPKWYIFGAGLVIIAAWFWKDWTFTGIWETVQNLYFWKPVGTYLLAGLVYSLLEFVLEVRRTARHYRKAWLKALDGQVSMYKLDVDGAFVYDAKNQRIPMTMSLRDLLASREQFTVKAMEEINHFINCNQLACGCVGLAYGEGTGIPEPTIKKNALADSIGVWTFFWPAYATSLVIGDLLIEVFNLLAETLVKISRRFVRFSFADVFKL